MNNTIKILHTEWSDGWGGQEIRIINEMLAVREQGVKVYLACREHSQIGLKAQQLDIPIFFLPFRGNLDVITLRKLIKIIKQHHIDILNSHSGKDTWVGGFAAKLARIKFIRTRHLSNNINRSRLNFINELADYIFTTGESVKENMMQYNRISPSKIMSIPTGIDESIFDPSKYNKQLCREKFKIKQNEIIIGNVGVLRSFKRHDIFIKIANRLIKKFPEKNLKFMIAGEGPKREALENQIQTCNLKDYVFLLGHLDNVNEFLAAIDIFLFTSDSKEGVPQSVMQALLMDKDTIATNAGSTKDLYNKNNFIICTCDENEIYENIVGFLNQKLKINKDRDFIVENISKKIMCEKIIRIYRKLLNRQDDLIESN